MVKDIEIHFIRLKKEENQNFRLIELKRIRIKLMFIILDPITNRNELKEAKYLLKQIEICIN